MVENTVDLVGDTEEPYYILQLSGTFKDGKAKTETVSLQGWL